MNGVVGGENMKFDDSDPVPDNNDDIYLFLLRTKNCQSQQPS